jgi:putative ABC transport system permease protein
MNKRLLLAGSVRTLSRYKLRTFFMSLGIVIGVAALVVMRSMGSGAEQTMLDRFERVFSGASIFVMNAGTGENKLTLDDIEAISAELDQVVEWNPTLTSGDREVRYHGLNRSLTIYGQSERAESVEGRSVTEGEYFSADDVRASARVALLGSKTADALFGDENPVGKRIQIGNSPFRVLGVLEPAGVDPHGKDRDDAVHVPITTLMRRLENVDTIGYAKLIISSTDEVDETADRIAEILQTRHALAVDEPDDFAIYTPVQVQRLIKEASRVLTVYLPAASGIALLVAGIVIANIMLIGVRERIAEIGLRKAVGATNRQISGQFLLESLAVTVISGALGVGIGAGVLVAVAKTMSLETRITPDSIVLGLAAALVIGMLAGFLPARRAALQEPVDALR